MKRSGSFFLCIMFVVFSSGCQNTKTRVVEGAVIGGLVGGAAGGIIGHQSGHAGTGAGIGVAAGALTGALIGSQIDKPQAETATATPTSTQAATQPAQPQTLPSQPAVAGSATSQLSMQQIVDMSKQGVKDDEIIAKIKTTNSKFNLSAAGINYLKQQGVSQRVIDAMK
jgi:uncharacterized protein YcfJ